jgi:hypothetical protein
MKKLLSLSLVFAGLISTTTYAQGGGPAPSQQPATQQPTTQQPATQLPTAEQYANMLKDAKEKQIPMLVEKAGLTAAQAEKVIELNFEMRQQAATALQGLKDADRSAKLAELKAAKEKKYSEIPLTADQIKAVYAAYEEMGKNMQKRQAN